MPERIIHDQGIADVDAWENVGRRIRGLNQAEEPGTDSGSGDCRDPQVCPVGEQGADQKADRHAAGKRDPQARHFVRIVEAEIEDGPQDVGKPEKVGDDKDRKHGDQIVRGAVHDADSGIRGNGLFQETEPP